MMRLALILCLVTGCAQPWEGLAEYSVHAALDNLTIIYSADLDYMPPPDVVAEAFRGAEDHFGPLNHTTVVYVSDVEYQQFCPPESLGCYWPYGATAYIRNYGRCTPVYTLVHELWHAGQDMVQGFVDRAHEHPVWTDPDGPMYTLAYDLFERHCLTALPGE